MTFFEHFAKKTPTQPQGVCKVPVASCLWPWFTLLKNEKGFARIQSNEAGQRRIWKKNILLDQFAGIHACNFRVHPRVHLRHCAVYLLTVLVNRGLLSRHGSPTFGLQHPSFAPLNFACWATTLHTGAARQAEGTPSSKAVSLLFPH